MQTKTTHSTRQRDPNRIGIPVIRQAPSAVKIPRAVQSRRGSHSTSGHGRIHFGGIHSESALLSRSHKPAHLSSICKSLDMQSRRTLESSQMPAHYAKAELAERGAIVRFKDSKR